MQDNVQSLAEELRWCKAKRIMVQLPEGLKTNTTELVNEMAKLGIETIVYNNPSFGACDLADEEAKQANCDLLVHVGHNKFYRDFGVAVPVLYFPWILDVSIEGVDFSSISENRIGLVSSIQHVHLLEKAKQKIEDEGKAAVVGGQILGCWTANAVKIENDVDAFLFVGSGVFHSLALRTGKPVYGLDVEKNAVEKLDLTLMEKRRWAHIYKAKDAKSFAILVSSKKGQHQLLGNAEKIKLYLEERGKKAYILMMNEITDAKLLGLRVDAFINTACPRLLDDNWSKPFINAVDVDKIFDE